MKLTAITVGINRVNTYILEFDNCYAVIDPGANYSKIASYIKDKPCTHVLLTHAHFDHIGAVAEFARRGAKVYLHNGDLEILHSDGNLASLAGVIIDEFNVDVVLDDGNVIDIDGTPIEVISTPGHTEGSVCYKIGNILFSGDTLFNLAVGRTDFPSSDPKKMRSSLNRIFMLQGVDLVYPGHGNSTTLEFEKENNPYA